MTPDRLPLASECSAALGALGKSGTVDIEACAALARRLQGEGIEATMHADWLRSEAQERPLGPGASTDDVVRKLGALKVALFIVSTWPWDMQAEYALGQILAELNAVTSLWSTSTIPGYPTESMIADSRRQAMESLDLHHMSLRHTHGGPATGEVLALRVRSGRHGARPRTGAGGGMAAVIRCGARAERSRHGLCHTR